MALSNSEKQKNYRERHKNDDTYKESIKAKNRNYYQRNKDKWNTSQQEHLKLIARMGGKCQRCGYNDVTGLQIDHVNGDGHKDSRRDKISGARLYKRMYAEIEAGSTDYQLLCANCNWKKRYENKEHSYRVK